MMLGCCVVRYASTSQANKQESLAIPHCSQNEKIKNGARRKEANQNPGETNYNRASAVSWSILDLKSILKNEFVRNPETTFFTPDEQRKNFNNESSVKCVIINRDMQHSLNYPQLCPTKIS